jgi:protein SCO1
MRRSWQSALRGFVGLAALGLALPGAVGQVQTAPPPSIAATAPFTVQTRRSIQPPDIALTSMTRRPSTLRKELDAAGPVIVNFVFTTCSSICSTQTATLAALQGQLRAGSRPARFLTFTIDPDNDTPEQLATFARQFGVAAGWDFFTGGFDDLVRQQQSFDVYRGAKASHPPVVLMRRDRSSPWVRIEGYPSPQDLRKVFEELPLS